MGKLKTLFVGALALACPILSAANKEAGEFFLGAAYASAGILDLENYHDNYNDNNYENLKKPSAAAEKRPQNFIFVPQESLPAENFYNDLSSAKEDEFFENSVISGEIITLGKNDLESAEEEVDYSKFTAKSGAVIRKNFGKFDTSEYITLKSGAQLRNCTDIPNSELEKAINEPFFIENNDKNAPRVLVYHTHTTESFLPFGDDFDEDYPIRSADPKRNMTAVGKALCEELSRRGVSVVHERTVHDYPMFTGAYYRSAETVSNVLENYPDIKIIIDLHRDGIINPDGSLTAPVCEINGQNAAQFMIISCCGGEDFEMPDYLENLKLACALQNCAEELYAGLARPILFDCRNYNQSLSPGCLLIEVGSQANSLEEAELTGKLLGEIIAKVLGELGVRN